MNLYHMVMNKCPLLTLFTELIYVSIFFVSQGDPGPPGPDGQNGPAGARVRIVDL